MRTNRLTRGAVQGAIAVALAAGLAACGGGGGGDDSPQAAPNIDLTTTNRDNVSHATAAGILGLSPTLTIPLAANGAAADRDRALAAGQTQPPVWSGRLPALVRQVVRHVVSTTGAKAASPMAHRLAVTGPLVSACAISGTMSIGVDDRDASGGLNAGDVVTIGFSNCQDTADETLNGKADTAIIALTATSLSARLTMSQLSDAAARHALTLDGSMLVDDAQPSGTLEVTRLTADGLVVASVTTHLFTDTVTLQSGFAEEATYDSVAGVTTSTVQGLLRSTAAGGIVELSSRSGAPITKYDTETYPRSGVLQVKGRKGTILLTALSTDSVQLDLDADDNGTAESSEVVNRDWLL